MIARRTQFKGTIPRPLKESKKQQQLLMSLPDLTASNIIEEIKHVILCLRRGTVKLDIVEKLYVLLKSTTHLYDLYKNDAMQRSFELFKKASEDARLDIAIRVKFLEILKWKEQLPLVDEKKEVQDVYDNSSLNGSSTKENAKKSLTPEDHLKIKEKREALMAKASFYASSVLKEKPNSETGDFSSDNLKAMLNGSATHETKQEYSNPFSDSNSIVSLKNCEDSSEKYSQTYFIGGHSLKLIGSSEDILRFAQNAIEVSSLSEALKLRLNITEKIAKGDEVGEESPTYIQRAPRVHRKNSDDCKENWYSWIK